MQADNTSGQSHGQSGAKSSAQSGNQGSKEHTDQTNPTGASKPHESTLHQSAHNQSVTNQSSTNQGSPSSGHTSGQSGGAQGSGSAGREWNSSPELGHSSSMGSSGSSGAFGSSNQSSSGGYGGGGYGGGQSYQRAQNPWQASNKGQSYWQQRRGGLAGRGQGSGGLRSGSSYQGQGRGQGQGQRHSEGMHSGGMHDESMQGWSMQGNENVGSTERIISAGLGGLLVAGGIVRGRLPGLLLTAAGASLLYRGLSGFCALYQQLGITTNEMDDEHSGQHFFSPDHHAIKGVKIEEEFEIDQSPHELYDMWTKWEQLPQYLPHIKQIEVLGEGRTRWTAFAPLGVTLTWEAETLKQEADRMVSWKSVRGDVATAGSVHFDEASSGKTRMRVSMQYDPPGGKATAQVAEFFGIGLERRVRDDLQQFKHRLESRGRAHAS